jgi:hypothetical protein
MFMHILIIVIELSVDNDKDVQSIDGSTTEDSHSLNHKAVRETRSQSRSKRGDRLDDFSSYHNHSFNVILPRKLSEHTDSDLRLMLVSLKNARCASTVHILRIERELKKRGSKLTILGRH